MLWPSLLSGVPTRFDAPPSHIFAPKESHPASDDLHICFGNWTGAKENPTLLAELIQQEVESGWLEEVGGWGERLAVGCCQRGRT